MKKWKIILTIVLALLIVPVAVGAVYMNLILDKVTVSEDEFDKDFDLNVNTNLENSNVKNIALFGVDCRTDDYSGCRSDVMMVISYDMKNNDVKVGYKGEKKISLGKYVIIQDNFMCFIKEDDKYINYFAGEFKPSFVKKEGKNK